jgi:hypothetical protein
LKNRCSPNEKSQHPWKEVAEPSQRPHEPSPSFTNDDPDFENEHNDLLDHWYPEEDVDQDRLYWLELIDRRKEGDELIDDELSDLDQFEEEQKVRLKTENPPDAEAGK